MEKPERETSTDMCTGCELLGDISEGVQYCVECRLHLCPPCWEEHTKRGCVNAMGTRVFMCHTCTERGRRERGIHYCEFCKIIMCSNCLDKYRDLFPKQNVTLRKGCRAARRNLEAEHCRHHDDVAVEYYCPCVDQVFCAECKQRSHAECKEVKYISEVCRELPVVEQCQQLIDTKKREITLCDEKLKEEWTLVCQKLSCVEKCEKLCELNEELATILTHLEDKIRTKTMAIFEEEGRNIQSNLSVLSVYKKNLEENQFDLKKAEKSKNQEIKLIATKSVDLKIVRECADQIEKESELAIEQIDVLEHVEELYRKLHAREARNLVTVTWQPLKFD